MFTNPLYSAWYDESRAKTRRILGELSGVERETLEHMDHVSGPFREGLGPKPDDANAIVYDALAHQAQAEHLAALEAKKGASGAKKAS